jgi:15-cis-phytoene synthase
MADHLTQGAEYCSRLVRARDEDRWLAAQYARPPERRALIALYAFYCELRRIPGAVSEAPLGEIRLQWWCEALQEIRDGKPSRAHPVVEEITACGIANAMYSEHLEAAIDAASRLFYGEGFGSIDDLTNWLGQAEGSLDALAVMVLGGDASLAVTAKQAGTAFAMAREGTVLAPNLNTDIQSNARLIWDKSKRPLNNAGAAAAPAILHLVLTSAYLKRGVTPFPIYKRARMFTAMAFGLF